MLEHYVIVHVQGTPATGKTRLARLLQDRLETNRRVVFMGLGWPPSSNRNPCWRKPQNGVYECGSKGSVDQEKQRPCLYYWWSANHLWGIPSLVLCHKRPDGSFSWPLNLSILFLRQPIHRFTRLSNFWQYTPYLMSRASFSSAVHVPRNTADFPFLQLCRISWCCFQILKELKSQV